MDQSLHRRPAALLGVLSALTLVLGLIVFAPSRAEATIAESDTFTGWTVSSPGNPTPSFRLTADTATKQDGAASLRVQYETASSQTKYVDLRQNVRAVGGTTYNLSAWVKTEGLTQSSDAYFVLSGDHSVRQELPAGTNDWTKLEWTYTQPAGSMTFLQRFLVRGPGTVWVDDMRMTAPNSTTNMLINGSFEQYGPPPDSLRFSDTALVYQTGDAQVGLVSYSDQITWDVRASSGQRIDSGVEAVASDDTAQIDLSGFAAGYYTLTASVSEPQALTRTVSLAIVDSAPTDHDASNPSDNHVGMAVHINRYSVGQVDALMDPLGAGSLREGPTWDTIETSPGVYVWPQLFDDQINASKQRGERPVVILAYFSRFYDNGKTPSSPAGIAAFANYARAAAEHFGPDVDYEVYNEFNHTFNNGACGLTADCYLPLLEAASDAIHDVAPSARVVGPVLAGDKLDWMERLFELGGLDFLDVVSYHTYDFPNAPEGRTEDRVDEVRALIDEYAPAGKDIPIWISEHGWTTTTGNTTEQQQAAYIVRSAVLLQDAGVERTWYYELIDSGVNPAETEHNFGLARLPKDGGTALTPKPSYAALTTYNNLTGDLDLMSLERLDGAIVATYGSGSTVVRIAWATGDRVTLRATVGSSGKVVKADGRSWRLRPGGPVEVTVGGDPVYLTGNIGALAVSTDPAVEIDTPDQLAVGAAPNVDVDVDRGSLSVTGAVQVVGPVGSGATFDADAGVLPLAAFRELGRHPVAYTVRSNNTVVAYVDDATTVVENPTIVLKPTLATNGNVSASVVMASVPGAAATSVTGLHHTIGETTGTLPDTPVASGQTVVLPIDSEGLEQWRPYPFTIEATVDGKARNTTGTTALASVAGDPDDATRVEWREVGTYTPFAGGTPTAEDLGGEFDLSWTAEGLRIRADVIDQDHTVATSADRLWAGDSIQFAVARGLPGTDPASRVEIGAYLGTTGPAVYRYTSPIGVVDEIDVAVTRAGTTTAYDVTVPWEQIGVDPDSELLSFSILVNDNDAGTREGYFGWGGGIGSGKDSTQFLPILLAPAAPQPATAATISIGGTPLADFDPETTEYSVEAFAGGPLPVVSATGADGATVEVTQASTAPGTATVVASAQGRESTTYQIAVTRTVGNDAAVDATVAGVCVGGKATWIVTAHNTAPYPEDIRATSTFDDKRSARVPAGQTVELSLTAASATVPAGTVTIAAYVPYAAPDRAASYVSHQLPAPSVTCPAP
ncbi:GH39 family glycosyl hydrolase [Microbacterium schleiferi]|uniref:Sugar-binding protein n=1 Tax=Microbacterium schleiferi TaxID=69362 RepID=A0ABU7V5H9_9MICO